MLERGAFRCTSNRVRIKSTTGLVGHSQRDYQVQFVLLLICIESTWSSAFGLGLVTQSVLPHRLRCSGTHHNRSRSLAGTAALSAEGTAGLLLLLLRVTAQL